MPRKRRRSNPKQRYTKQTSSCEEDWCEIKGILDEREVDGDKQYLVAWEDHPQTGEVYPHEWKTRNDLSEESSAQWEENKRRQASSARAQEQQTPIGTAETDESQEPVPATRHRRSSLPLDRRPRPKLLAWASSQADSQESDRRAKRIRLASDLSASPVPSFTSSVATASEEPESPGQAPTNTRCQVLLGRKSDFDPTEYHSVVLTQSSARDISSQSVSILESQDQDIVLSAAQSQGTIPDSQEVPTLETQESGPSEAQIVDLRDSQCSSLEAWAQPVPLTSQNPGPVTLAQSTAVSLGANSSSDTIPSQSAESGSWENYQGTAVGSLERARGKKRAEYSIPSHQPEHLQYSGSWTFDTPERGPPIDDSQSQSRVTMSTPQKPRDPAELGSQSSRQQESSTSQTTSAYLTQPAQPPLDLEVEPSDYSRRLAEERAKLDESDSDEVAMPGFDSDDAQDNEAVEGILNASASVLEPATVTPADIEPAQPTTEIPVLPSIDLSSNSIPVSNLPVLHHTDSAGSNDHSTRSTSPKIITLPLLAANRREYNVAVLKRLERAKIWGEAFQKSEAGQAPLLIEEAAAAVDDLFFVLQNLCDLPAGDAQDILSLPQSERAKWWTSASPKFCFLYELLKGLGESIDLKLVIVVDSDDLLLPLCDLMVYTGTVDFACPATNQVLNRPSSTIHVTIARLQDQVNAWDADIVIAYNRAFNGSKLENDLMGDSQGRTRPLVLKLVISQSLEHVDIDARNMLPPPATSDEHKYLLLLGITENLAAIKRPPRVMPLNERPTRLAEALCQYLLDDVDWTEVDLEPEALEFPAEALLEATEPSDLSNVPEGVQKRERDEDDEAIDEVSKRARRYSHKSTNLPAPALNDDLRTFLEKGGWNGVTRSVDLKVTVPLSVVESLRAQFTDLELSSEHLRRQKYIEEQFVKSVRQQERDDEFYVKASDEIRNAYTQRSALEAEVAKLTAALEKKDAEHAKAQEKANTTYQELEAKYLRLQAEKGVTDTENELTQAQAKIKLLEKRLETAKETAEYAKDKYQEISAAMSGTMAENSELQQQNAKLLVEADSNRVEIHRMNNEHSTKALQKQIAEQQAMLAFKDGEIANLHRDNQQLKAKREPRAASAPRSPRPGLMSPRGRGGSGLSREASPVIGTFSMPGGNGGFASRHFTNPNGGERWGRGTPL